jgi:hypothetical protein
LTALQANSVQAQVPRIQIRQGAYDVTIISEFGFPVRVGIFGYSEQATFRLSFDGGRTGPDVYQQKLIAGDRVIIVWDTRGRRLLVADLTVNSSGALVLGPQIAAAAAKRETGNEPRGAKAKSNAIPRLKIKPKK